MRRIVREGRLDEWCADNINTLLRRSAKRTALGCVLNVARQAERVSRRLCRSNGQIRLAKRYRQLESPTYRCAAMIRRVS